MFHSGNDRDKTTSTENARAKNNWLSKRNVGLNLGARMSLIPRSKPKLTKGEVEKILEFKKVNRDRTPVCVVAVRGYYLNTMGAAGKNDRGIYDDAAFICSPNLFASVNWNTDPTTYRKGHGTKDSTKGMATLKPGVWLYQIGRHKLVYPACVQAQAVTVVRDGTPDYEDTGWFGINHHPGGKGTSSLGCQTAPPEQWPSYIKPLVAQLNEYKQKVFPYVLITEDEMAHILARDLVPETEKPEPQPTLPKSEVNRDMVPAVKIIKEFEGFFSKAYLDPVGIPTIGWGTIQYPNGTKVRMGDYCSAEQATEWLMHEVREKAMAVERLVKVKLSNNAFCALTSFAYNCGIGAFEKSTMLRKLNSGADKAEVALEFDKWVYAGGKVLKGLVRRRNAEKKLFLA